MARLALLLLATLIAGCASQGIEPARSARTIPSCDDVQATTIHRLDGSSISSDVLTERIEALRQQAEVHGMAISIFNDRQLVYCKAFGVKRTDTQEPLRTDTNIYGASLSKAVSAVLFMRLVEEGILDLDTPLVSYLDKPVYAYEPEEWHEDFKDLKDDLLHRKITARMSLAHTTGFPNWRWFEPDQKLRLLFEPGARYSYSGEGFTFLQVILEKRTQRPLGDWMREKIFEPYGMTTSSYTWQPRFEEDYSHGHNETGEIFDKDKDNAARAPSTLETTPEDYARFIHAVLNGKGLKESSWKEMFTPQVRIRTKTQFGPPEETTDAYDDIELSYGLGWGLLKTPHGWGAFKEGHGDGFEHYSIIFPDRGMGVVIMTNSANGESLYKHLLELTIADTYTPLEWNERIPFDQETR
jgi:D-alanyl-D-alanine-carboxypeptidase/D-alanyl-D-alanine-endopeptidase